jgi:hypothetical protein
MKINFKYIKFHLLIENIKITGTIKLKKFKITGINK